MAKKNGRQRSPVQQQMVRRLPEVCGSKGSARKPGCPYDNCCAESFFASRKKKFILRKEYDGMSALKRNIFYYVEIFYNRERLHSTLGCMNSIAYRLQH